MKRLVMIALLFGFFACTQTPSYKVNVKLDSAEGEAYLSQRIKGEWVKLDSAMIENGVCKFKGAVKNPDVFYLSVGKRKDKLLFFIENSVISITGKIDSLTDAKVSGSKINDEYLNLQDKLDSLDRQGMALFNQSKDVEKTGDKVKADSLMTLAENVFNSIDEQQKTYIKAHPASYISPYLLSRIYYDMEADVLERFLAGMDAKLDSLPAIVTLKGRVAKLKTVAIGQTAPDFTMNDINGNPVKLSDIYSVNSIPANLLVDKTGKIIGRNLREEKLRETIAGLLK